MSRVPPTDLHLALKSCRSSFVGAGVFSFFINVLMLVGPLYMLQIYDRVLMSSSVPTLLAITGLIVLLMAVMGILEWIRSMVLIRVGAKMDGLLTLRLFNATLDYAATKQNPSGQPIRDLDAVRQFMTGMGCSLSLMHRGCRCIWRFCICFTLTLVCWRQWAG